MPRRQSWELLNDQAIDLFSLESAEVGEEGESAYVTKGAQALSDPSPCGRPQRYAEAKMESERGRPCVYW